MGGNNFGDGVVPYIVSWLGNSDNTLNSFHLAVMLSRYHGQVNYLTLCCSICWVYLTDLAVLGMEEMALTLGRYSHLTEFHALQR